MPATCPRDGAHVEEEAPGVKFPGLKINLWKSEFIQIGEVDGVESLSSIFGCRVARLPMKYLRLPLVASYKSSSIWNGIVEKIERRLVG